jgi:hypothetical protein
MMMNALRDDRADLIALTDFVGPAYNTDAFCMFLYSLVRLHAPRNVVELGAGLGASAFWMALAAKHNGKGRVWTVDHLELFKRDKTLLTQIARHLGTSWGTPYAFSTPIEYFEGVKNALGIDAELTILDRAMDLDDPRHFDEYPFAAEPIDLLFSDFEHGPGAIVRLLAQFLPKMSPASSILIDSASTNSHSYLMLEQIVGLLNSGRVPASLQAHASLDLREAIRDRQIQLIHLTRTGAAHQNSSAWIKIQPVDTMPYPAAIMRGI